MATFLEKLTIFEKEQVKAITASFGGKPKAVKVDIDKLRSWLEAHQEVKASSEVKAKLFTIIEKYNRAHASLAVLHGPLKALFEDLMRLGQNFLDTDGLNKVNGWLTSLKEEEADSSSTTNIEAVSRWSVESIDPTTKLVSLMSVVDQELWKEDFQLPEPYLSEISGMMEDIDKGLSIIVEIDENLQTVVKVIRQ